MSKTVVSREISVRCGGSCGPRQDTLCLGRRNELQGQCHQNGHFEILCSDFLFEALEELGGIEATSLINRMAGCEMDSCAQDRDLCTR